MQVRYNHVKKNSLDLKSEQKQQYLTPEKMNNSNGSTEKYQNTKSQSVRNSGNYSKNNDSTQPQTLQKEHLSQFNQSPNAMDQSLTSNNSRRFSFFSKSSFATCNSMIFGIRNNQKNQSAPKVNISNIIKNRANLYHDEDLEHTFDNLLEKAYEIVLNKKQMRDLLKEDIEGLNQEINALKLEFQPLQNSISKLQEKIAYYKDLQEKIEAEQRNHRKEVQKLQVQLDQRNAVIRDEEIQLLEQIKQLELQNTKKKSEINISKQDHRLQRDNYEKEIKQRKQELNTLTQILTDKRNKFEVSKLDQATKLRKMENKSKMFLGILKH